jgi:hypothetical protein
MIVNASLQHGWQGLSRSMLNENEIHFQLNPAMGYRLVAGLEK